MTTQGYKFNGSSAYITVPDAAEFDTTAGITFFAWIRCHAWGTNVIMWRDDTSSNRCFQFYLNSSGKLVFVLYDTTLTYHSLITNKTYQVDEWMTVTSTYDGITMRSYTNGVVDVNTTIETFTPNTSAEHISIGIDNDYNQYHFNGTIYDIQYYTRCLSPTEVWDLHRGLAVDDTNLVGWWKLDGDATDSSGNSNTGTANNGTYVNIEPRFQGINTIIHK